MPYGTSGTGTGTGTRTAEDPLHFRITQAFVCGLVGWTASPLDGLVEGVQSASS